MTRKLFALVPVKDPEHGKSRLAPCLGAAGRRALNHRLAESTLALCADVFGAAQTLRAEGPALNTALADAATRAMAGGAEGIVVVPIDLVLLDATRLRHALSKMPESPGCLIVPDRQGRGTNLLGLAPARSDLFAFGESSFARHAAAAARHDFQVRIHHCDAIGQDLDEPDDFDRLRRRLRG